ALTPSAHTLTMANATRVPSASVSGGNTGWGYGSHTGTAHVPSCCTCSEAQPTTYMTDPGAAISGGLGRLGAQRHEVHVALQGQVAVIAQGERTRIDVVFARGVRRT